MQNGFNSSLRASIASEAIQPSRIAVLLGWIASSNNALLAMTTGMRALA
jgi:hypothetical protein